MCCHFLKSLLQDQTTGNEALNWFCFSLLPQCCNKVQHCMYSRYQWSKESEGTTKHPQLVVPASVWRDRLLTAITWFYFDLVSLPVCSMLRMVIDSVITWWMFSSRTSPLSNKRSLLWTDEGKVTKSHRKTSQKDDAESRTLQKQIHESFY